MWIFLGVKAPLGLVRVSQSVTKERVWNCKISQDCHVYALHRSWMVTGQEWQVRSDKSRVTSQELKANRCMSRFTGQEWEVKRDMSKIISQEWQINGEKSTGPSQEWQVRSYKAMQCQEWHIKGYISRVNIEKSGKSSRFSCGIPKKFESSFSK